MEAADHVERIGDVDRPLELRHALDVRVVVTGDDAPECVDVRIGQDLARHAGYFARELASGELLRRHEAGVIGEHFLKAGQHLADVFFVR